MMKIVSSVFKMKRNLEIKAINMELELIKKVLNLDEDVRKVSISEIDKSIINYTLTGARVYQVNKFEFANKCKEWAFTMGYEVSSSLKKCTLRKYDGGFTKLFRDDEAEAVIKACCFIFKEIKNERD